MTNIKNTLSQLNQNLNTLREREARHGGEAPIALLDQISDHKKAIVLTEQAIEGELTEAEWREALKPLLVSIEASQVQYRDAQYRTALNWDGQVRLRGFDLSGRNLSSVNLKYADLAGANLSQANLSGAIYNSTTKWHHQDFDPSMAGAIKKGWWPFHQ